MTIEREKPDAVTDVAHSGLWVPGATETTEVPALWVPHGSHSATADDDTTDQDDTADQEDDDAVIVSAIHRDALAAMTRKGDAIAYICAQLGHPETAEVRRWLAAAGIDADRKYVSRKVSAWKRGQELSDTDTFQAITANMLDELDPTEDDDDAAAAVAPVTQPVAPEVAPVAQPVAPVAQPVTAPVSATPEPVADDGAQVAPSVAPVAQSAPTPPSATSATDADDDAVPVWESSAPAPVALAVAPVAPETEATPGRVTAPGAWGFYAVAVVSLIVSVDTSWRYFRDVIGITNTLERAAMFSVLELALIAAGFGMAANVRRGRPPGSAQLFAWGLCGFAGFMAWQLSGPGVGVARVVLGPVIGMVALHLALGIERQARTARTGVWGRVLGELRERFLTLLHIADDDRDAAQRTRDQAAQRVARLALGGWVPFRDARLRRAVRASGAAHDPDAKARMLAELDAERHIGQLATLERPSPWE